MDSTASGISEGKAKLKCMLLVDDDPATLYIHQLLVEDLGISYDLLMARNGKEALQLLTEHYQKHQCIPELILLDINMPVLDGFGFLEAYQSLDFPEKTAVIIVMVTTSMNPEDVERANQYPIAGYLSKPLKEESLCKLLEHHFNINR